MKTKSGLAHARRLAVFAMALLLSGCVTPALWKEQNRKGTFVPAKDPGLAIYESSQPADLLVVFEQGVVNSRWQTRRAYYLFANEAIINTGGKPHFVSQSKARNLPAIPIFSKEDFLPAGVNQPGFYAVTNREHGAFLLYRDGELVGRYKLPEYVATHNLTGRIVMTPVAVGVDVGIGCMVLLAFGAPGGAH